MEALTAANLADVASGLSDEELVGKIGVGHNACLEDVRAPALACKRLGMHTHTHSRAFNCQLPIFNCQPATVRWGGPHPRAPRQIYEQAEAELSLAGNMLKWKPWEGTAATVDMALTRKTPMPVCRAAWAALTRGTLLCHASLLPARTTARSLPARK
jgi:hypothetical protein